MSQKGFVNRQLISSCLAISFLAMTLVPKEVRAADPEIIAKKLMIHKTLKDIYVAQRKVPEASAEFKELLALEPNDPRAHYEYGRFLAINNQANLAVPQYRQAAKLAPGVAEYQGGLGLALMYSKDYDGAVAAFSKACALGGKQYQNHLQMAQQYQAQHKQLEQYTKQVKQQQSGDDDE